MSLSEGKNVEGSHTCAAILLVDSTCHPQRPLCEKLFRDLRGMALARGGVAALVTLSPNTEVLSSCTAQNRVHFGGLFSRWAGIEAYRLVRRDVVNRADLT